MNFNAYIKILNALDTFALNAMVTALQNGWKLDGTDLEKVYISDSNLKNIRNNVKKNILFMDKLIQEDLYIELHVNAIPSTEQMINYKDNLLTKLNNYYSTLLEIIESSSIIKNPEISTEEFVQMFEEDGIKATKRKDLKNISLIIESTKAIQKIRVAMHDYQLSSEPPEVLKECKKRILFLQFSGLIEAIRTSLQTSLEKNHVKDSIIANTLKEIIGFQFVTIKSDLSAVQNRLHNGDLDSRFTTDMINQVIDKLKDLHLNTSALQAIKDIRDAK